MPLFDFQRHCCRWLCAIASITVASVDLTCRVLGVGLLTGWCRWLGGRQLGFQWWISNCFLLAVLVVLPCAFGVGNILGTWGLGLVVVSFIVPQEGNLEMQCKPMLRKLLLVAQCCGCLRGLTQCDVPESKTGSPYVHAGAECVFAVVLEVVED